MMRWLMKFIKRYGMWWYGLTVALYGLMIPLTIWVFPATTLLLTIVVLFGGFTSSLAALASALTNAAQDESLNDLQDDVANLEST